MHRDIKPENILLRPGPRTHKVHHDREPFPDVVLADFGHATHRQFEYTPYGTSLWNPPELPRSSPKGDLWSVGAVIHFLVHGKAPIAKLPRAYPKTKEYLLWWEAQAEARYVFTHWPAHYSPHLKHAMLSVLRSEEHRPTAALLYDMVFEWAAKAMTDKARFQSWGLKRWAFPKEPRFDI